MNQNPLQTPEPPSESAPYTSSPEENRLTEFVSVVLADTEDTWDALFRSMGKISRSPIWCFFRRRAIRLRVCLCGRKDLLFPADRKLYIDLSYYRDCGRSSGAADSPSLRHCPRGSPPCSKPSRDRRKVQDLRRRTSRAEGDQLSVLVELQADSLTGVSTYSADTARKILEKRDIEEPLKAASRIGNDRLQKESRGFVFPDSFTNGRSAQRVHWFKRGFETGEVGQCNTFSSEKL